MKQALRSLLICSSCLIGLFSPSIFSEDLLQVYHQAVLSDPAFAQAESSWQSQKMNLPIAEAGYLPQVGTTAFANKNYANSSLSNVTSALNGYSWTYGFTLTLTQPLFNFAVWAQIKKASASVKAATASYLAAEQSLMQRTAKAYFDVLQAYDQLRYTVADKNAVWEQLVTSEQKFKVGLIAITDVYDARSSYDNVTAKQIAAQNNLNIQLENLRAITGVHYSALNGIRTQLPLLKPQPDNIEQWVDVANEQNYSIKAQNYTVIAAMDNIKQQRAAGYPSINLQGGVTQTQTADNPSNTIGIPNNSVSDTQILGLNLAYNPIQGGAVIATTKQARYDYVTASGKLDQIHRQVVDDTRSSFLTASSSISQIKADKERIVAAQNALDATEAGLKVGTRTMVDVLNALTTVYQAQQQYANDQYAHLNSVISLKLAAGTLSLQDLTQINSWMKKRIVFPNEDSTVILKSLDRSHQTIVYPKTQSVGLPNDSVDEVKKLIQSRQLKSEPAEPKKPTPTSTPEPVSVPALKPVPMPTLIPVKPVISSIPAPESTVSLPGPSQTN